ncbi:MAG: histidine kinase N-terminal 7TM domain-containing protein [Ruminiclostridium sp.]
MRKSDYSIYLISRKARWTAIKRINSAFIYAAIAVIAAALLRQIGFRTEGALEWFSEFFRSVIYAGLFGIWGISVRRRIIQPQVRRYLTAISALMVFWVTVRTIKYMFAENPWILRQLWYLYYLPMLFIPCLAVFVALSLGKPDSFRLPKWTVFLYIPTAAIFLLVLTNDLHQLAFVFPENAAVWGNEYRYSAVYFLAIGWLSLCALAAISIILIKCRIPGSRRFFLLPFVPVILALIYGVLYIFRVPWLKHIAGDMTVVFCLLITAVLESCIACGLIQSNTGYDELFMVSRLGAQITDKENTLRLAGPNAPQLTEEQKISAEKHPVAADKNRIVKSQPIRFGHVLWQEDITELAEAIEQIEENCRNLAERNRIRQENLETRKKILALQEKNRATDLLHKETAEQIDLIDRMLTRYDTETNEAERRRLLAEAAVVGAYIKRYGNLLLIGEGRKTADIRDLSRCFEESFVNLELLDISCLCSMPSDITLMAKDMLRVYSAFEAVLENCLDSLKYVWVNARESRDCIFLNIEFVCSTDLSPFALSADSFSREDGAYRFAFRLQRGGEEK